MIFARLAGFPRLIGKKTVWPYLSGLILVAYMASVKIYKIWYLATACVLALFPVFVRPSWRDIADFLDDAKWFILYWIAVIVSVITSINPELSRLALLVDSIYPCVFLIFYFVGLRANYNAIERTMRLQVYAALVVLLFTIDIRIQDRIGYRLMFILPYVTPFVAAAVCRNSRGAVFELSLLTLLIVITNSRAQIGVAVLLTLASLFIFRTSTRRFLARSALAFGVSAAMIFIAAQFQHLKAILFTTAVRATGQSIGGVPVPIDDHARGHISELFWQLAPSNGWTGIGYFAFGPVYVSRHYDSYTEMSLHSIYEVWWLEMGYLGTAAALSMLGAFFFRMYRSRGNMTVQACVIGLIGVLVAGTVHQMHQAPMLYVMLGMGLGAARRALASNALTATTPHPASQPHPIEL
jgi:hypothetical protein